MEEAVERDGRRPGLVAQRDRLHRGDVQEGREAHVRPGGQPPGPIAPLQFQPGRQHAKGDRHPRRREDRRARSRRTRTATAPSRWRGPRSRPAPPGSVSRSSRRASSCAPPASTRRSSCSPSSRPAGRRGPRGRPRAVAVHGRTRWRRLAADRAARHAVHLKVDTGMHRVGVPPPMPPPRSPARSSHADLRLGGLWTHFAGRSEPDEATTRDQLALFRRVVADVMAAGHPPASCTRPTRRGDRAPRVPFDLVRAPASRSTASSRRPASAPTSGCDPRLALRSAVSHTKRLRAGDRVSYGLRYALDRRRHHRHGADRLRRRCPRNLAATDAEVHRPRAAVPHRGHGHDGPADGRRRRSAGRGRRRRDAARDATATRR